ncbi:hypothetical protein ACTPEW_10275 [Clostridioides difficile]
MVEREKKLQEVEVEVEEIEGYNYCKDVPHQCLHDCIPLGNQVLTPNN